MMKRVVTFLLALTFYVASANNVDEANAFFDEVLSTHFPKAVKDAGMELYELPSFSHNFQNRTSDGFSVNVKVIYHSGNMTGLQNAVRSDCQPPLWRSGNITAECSIIFPKLSIKYENRYQVLTGIDKGMNFRQHEYAVNAEITNLVASLDVTSSPHIRIPAVKNLQITKQGTPQIAFETIVDISYERLSTQLYHKLLDIMYELFASDLKNVLGEAVKNVEYPKN